MRRRIAVFLVLAAVLGGTGFTPAVATTASPVVVTPAQALTIVTRYMAALSLASTEFDTSRIDRIEAGSARQLDDADFTVSRSVGYGPYNPIKAVSQKVYLPRQTRYPAVFVAVTRRQYGLAQPNRDLQVLLFQRATSHDTWRVTAEPRVNLPALPSFTVGKDGYLPTLDASTLALPPAQLYPSLLGALNTAAAGNGVAAPWVDNSVWRATLIGSADDTVDYHERYQSTHLVPVCLAATKGAVCFASVTDASDSALDASEQAQGYTYDIESLEDRYDAGGIAAGQYVSLHRVAVMEFLAVVPRKQANPHVVLSGERWGPLSGTGVLAPAQIGMSKNGDS